MPKEPPTSANDAHNTPCAVEVLPPEGYVATVPPSDDAIRSAIVRASGVLGVAAKDIGVERQWLGEYISEHPHLERYLREQEQIWRDERERHIRSGCIIGDLGFIALSTRLDDKRSANGGGSAAAQQIDFTKELRDIGEATDEELLAVIRRKAMGHTPAPGSKCPMCGAITT